MSETNSRPQIMSDIFSSMKSPASKKYVGYKPRPQIMSDIFSGRRSPTPRKICRTYFLGPTAEKNMSETISELKFMSDIFSAAVGQLLALHLCPIFSFSCWRSTQPPASKNMSDIFSGAHCRKKYVGHNFRAQKFVGRIFRAGGARALRFVSETNPGPKLSRRQFQSYNQEQAGTSPKICQT